jgi:hypothetical protein
MAKTGVARTEKAAIKNAAQRAAFRLTTDQGIFEVSD